MKSHFRLAARAALPALSMSALAVPLWAEAAAAADGLELERVLLSTGGVGYFEYSAEVEGDALLDLTVRLDQVDDVLKSVVVYDDTGRVGEITLPGREPLVEAFRELPFGSDALASPSVLLGALRGASVTATGPTSVSGRIVSVEREDVTHENGSVETRHRVTVLAAEGLRQFILESAETLIFDDPALQGAVDQALQAVARQGERDRRTLSVRLAGEGRRTVHVAYVVEAPLWKSSYRLTVDADSTVTEAELQGWAVLENMSGQDWDGVELTVVSGNPVTFRQALYQAYYVDRPMVPVEVLGRVMPRVDQGAVAVAELADAAKASDLFGALGRAAAAPAPQVAMESATFGAGIDMVTTPGQAQLMAASSSEAATQVAFTLPDPVTVRAGDSVLVPIVARSVPAERVSLYQPDVDPRHPLASVELTNDGESGLPPGIITLFERALSRANFVGDARLAPLPAGDERLVSFAVDQKVTIDRADKADETIAEGRIADGVLRLTVRERAETTYTIEGAAREPRKVILEHPRRGPDWTRVAPDGEGIEATDTHWRLPVDVQAGETVTERVVEERPRYEEVRLIDLADWQIGYYAGATSLSQELRQQIAALQGYRTAIAEARAAASALETRLSDLVDSQARIRANLSAVPSNSDLHRRYLESLGQSEDEIEALGDELKAARERVAEAERALADYIAGLG